MAFDNLERTATVSAVESHAHNFVQDIKDFFLPHNASDLCAQSGKSDQSLGGILPNCEISFDDNPKFTPYPSSESVEPYISPDPDASNMSLSAARVYQDGKGILGQG